MEETCHHVREDKNDMSEMKRVWQKTESLHDFSFFFFYLNIVVLFPAIPILFNFLTYHVKVYKTFFKNCNKFSRFICIKQQMDKMRLRITQNSTRTGG